MEETYFITLRCNECENDNCTLCPCGIVVDEENLRGCTRKVSEDDFARYEHYINEVAPFLHLNTYKASSSLYKEIIDFLFYLYQQPLGQQIGRSGRILSR